MATAIVVAAGSGERLAAGVPKAAVGLAGQPMLAWSLRALERAEAIDRAVVAAPLGFDVRFEQIAEQAAPALDVTVVVGGVSRSESVANALAPVSADETAVVVHDAARPLAPPSLFDRCVAELDRLGCDAAIAAAPITDTVKRADGDLRVVETLDRSALWAVQTPQAFRCSTLAGALERAGDLALATDDAMLVERNGGDVRIVEASPENIKVTVPADLVIAELLLSRAD